MLNKFKKGDDMVFTLKQTIYILSAVTVTLTILSIIFSNINIAGWAVGTLLCMIAVIFTTMSYVDDPNGTLQNKFLDWVIIIPSCALCFITYAVVECILKIIVVIWKLPQIIVCFILDLILGGE